MTVNEIMELATDYGSECLTYGMELSPNGSADDRLLAAQDKDIALFRLKAAIEELHRDAARYQWMIKNATWYRESDDAIMAFRVAKKSNLSCVAMRQLAIDAAIQEST